MEPNEFAVAAAITAGLVEATKRMGAPTRFAPAVAIVFGVAVVALESWPLSSTEALWGIMAGLTAAGLYSGVKTTAGK